jgi:hypothetical protein
MLPSLLRQFIVYVLLLFLPLQAVAAGAMIACPIAYAPKIQADLMMEDCGDSAMMHTSTADTSGHDGRNGAPERLIQCGMSSSCLALSAIAVLSELNDWQIGTVFSPIGYADNFYISHIPQGLQRPPQVS